MKLKPINEQAVVILGANSGIGRATALLLGEKGAKLVLAGRSQEELDKLANEIQQSGGQTTSAVVDVTDFAQVKAVADRAVETYGRLDTWVHLAAVSLYAKFDETNPEEFKQVIDVNLTGQAYGAMAALPYIKNEGRGALIHITSLEAKRPLPLQSAYTASKTGTAAFLQALRMELEHEGQQISVTNIMPSSINTPFFDKALSKLGVKPAPIPPVYQPVVVARAIAYAAEHPVRALYVGSPSRMLSIIQRISPQVGDILLNRIAYQGQRSDTPKSPYDPSNLFSHLDGYDRAQGDFSYESRAWSVTNWLQTHPAARVGLTLASLGAAAFVTARSLMARRL